MIENKVADSPLIPKLLIQPISAINTLPNKGTVPCPVQVLFVSTIVRQYF